MKYADQLHSIAVVIGEVRLQTIPGSGLWRLLPDDMPLNLRGDLNGNANKSREHFRMVG